MKDFSVDDLNRHRKVMDLHGHALLQEGFGTVRSVELQANDYASRIWRFGGDGKEANAFTGGPGNDTSPRLSPDGRELAFISDRAGSSQIYLMPVQGGEAVQVGHFDKGVSDFRWAADGKTLFVAAAVAVDPQARGQRPAGPGASREQTAPEVCWKLPYKSDGVGYLLAREIHLHSLAITSGDVARMTNGAFDVLSFSPSPNGKHVAYVRTREGKFAHCSDLWVCDVEGRRHRRVTRTLSTVLQPSWANGGNFLAFAGAKKDGDGESRLWLVGFPAGEPRCLDDEVEVADPDNIFWDDTDEALTFARAWHGRHQLVRLTIGERRLDVLLGGDRQIGAFAKCASGWLCSFDEPARPSEVFLCSGGKERPVSRLNAWWHERPPIACEARSFDVPDGKGGIETIEGWLIRKKGARGAQPLLVDVHGGPASYALLDYDTNVYWHEFCSRGWAVLLLNAVGSSSFGSEFCSRLSGHWGEMDLPQYLAALETLRDDGLVNGRIAIAGKSYGGYFTSWAIGHVDLFESAVVMAPVGNIETHYGTSDGGYYADPLYLRTAPGFDRRNARTLSPLQHIEKATTPTLFLQGKDDERCPKCQSEELFVSLYNAGETRCELVLYPEEGHTFLGEGRPQCRADAARRIVDWVTQQPASVPEGRLEEAFAHA